MGMVETRHVSDAPDASSRDVSAPCDERAPARGALARVLAVIVAGACLLAHRPARADGPIAPPRRLDDAAAPYPAGAHGDAPVVLTAVVDADGVVTDVTVLRGEPPFADAAAAAVRAWRFAPASRDGTPVASRVTATVTFRAPSPASASPPAPPPTTAAPAGPPTSASAPPGDTAPTAEVAVRGEREELDTNHIPRSETRFVPGAFGDPFRAIEALPGMAPWLSGLPYYYVRGSPPESVGYAIDGIRVPLLFHVGAGPSTLAPALVDSVDLFPGAYPARYGRYAGAVVAGETAPPETDRPHAEFGARVFDANAFGEVPFDDGRGSALAAARYSYTGLLTSIIVPDYTVAYWDYQARATHRTWGADTASLFVFGSHDELTYKGQPTFRVEYHRADLRYDHPLPGGNLRVAATFSADDTLTAVQTPTGAGANAALKGPGGRVRVEVVERIDPTARVRAGGDLGVTRFDVDRLGDLVHAPHTDFEGGVYADVVWRPSRVVELVPGVRLDGYHARGVDTFAPQPRVAAKVQVTPGLAWISALGTAHQEATEEVFVPAKLPAELDRADAYQFSEAFEARLPSSMRLRGTAFASRIVVGGQDTEQESKGIEIFLRRDFTQRLGGFVSYTLSRTDAIQGSTVAPALPDRTHLVSVVLGYDLGRGWRTGARFFFESGRRYQVECPTPGCAPTSAPVAPGAGSYEATGTLAPFYRLDVRIEKRWTFSGGQWLAGTLECFNTLDKAEPTGEDYVPAVGLVPRTQSPIILPSIGIEGGL